MTVLVAERGGSNVTVAQIVERAGVSRRTFYEIFTDREECFLAAFDDCVASLAEVVLPAFHGSGRWRERVRAGLGALLCALESDPGVARLLIVESLSAVPGAVERRRRVSDVLVAAVDEGRREAKTGSALPSITAEGVVGGVLAVLHGRLVEGGWPNAAAGGSEGLVGLTGALMSMIVLPYLGPAVARRELERPVPVAPARPHVGTGDPLRGLGMRLTYRTVRVLAAVAEHPGASNRVVGQSAGVSDQGQISKLLSRLQRLGLVERSGGGAGRGEPNAWALTEMGGEVHGAIAY
ncbi:MAG: MarR family transcriptional regulator [Solirubrobacteraceae bacterium]